MPHLAVALAALAACAQPPVRPPPRVELQLGPQPLALTLPDRGALELDLLPGWTVSVEEARPGEDTAPFAFRLEPGDGRFVAFVAPEPYSREEAVAANVARTRALATGALRAAAEGSAERELVLRELKGDGGVRGFWFTATDRELAGRTPSRDEWRGLLRGAAVIGDLLVTFTLFDDLPGRHRELFLDTLATARHLPPEPPEPESPGDRAAVAASELSVALPGRAWSVTVGVPGFLVAAPVVAADGRSVMGHARDPASGIGLWVAIRDAEWAGTPAACRDRELARVRGAVGGVRDVRASERGDAAFATYVTSIPGRDGLATRRWHSRAWYRRDDACVAVHLTADGGTGGGVADVILGALRFVGAR